MQARRPDPEGKACCGARLQPARAWHRQTRPACKLLYLLTLVRQLVAQGVEVTVVNSYILYKQQMAAQERRPLTHFGFRRELVSSLSEPSAPQFLTIDAVVPEFAHSRNHSSQNHTSCEKAPREGTVGCAATERRVASGN